MCLAILAIQMTAWQGVVQMVVTALGDSPESHACMLDFLKVLPEEVTEGRKINLTVCGPKYTLREPTSTSCWEGVTSIRI